MSTIQDSLTPKRVYLESRIRHHASAANVPIDNLSWHRPHNQDVSELTITSGSKRKPHVIAHTDNPPGFALLTATNGDLEEFAKTIVRDLGQ